MQVKYLFSQKLHSGGNRAVNKEVGKLVIKIKCDNVVGNDQSGHVPVLESSETAVSERESRSNWKTRKNQSSAKLGKSYVSFITLITTC